MDDAAAGLVFVATSDLAGILRGKAFPAAEWEKRRLRGVGWTPTNVQITCFDTIAESPFGSLGDLALVPDPGTRVRLTAEGSLPVDLVLGDICHLDGQPWEHCTRGAARRALAALEAACGAQLVAAFEHEFQVVGQAPRAGDAFGFRGFRDAQPWAEALLAALARAGCRPDTFLKEYGPGQFEITVKPAAGLAAADQAVFVRALTHDILPRFGAVPSFAPILDPASVGNGVHLHLSLADAEGAPLTHDPADPHGLSALARHFIGGVLAHLDQILALLAPSEVSYLRLVPHRWSAAFNNLGYRDREAAVRICPVSQTDPEAVARQFNFEVRALDAAASPHLALAAIVFAGVEGIERRIEPPAPTAEDLSLLPPAELAARGFRRLPQSLPEALEALGASAAARRWFGDSFVDVYLAHKAGEMQRLQGLGWPEKCRAYGEVY
jgi:glutamine synthetase